MTGIWKWNVKLNIHGDRSTSDTQKQVLSNVEELSNGIMNISQGSFIYYWGTGGNWFTKWTDKLS